MSYMPSASINAIDFSCLETVMMALEVCMYHLSIFPIVLKSIARIPYKKPWIR